MQLHAKSFKVLGVIDAGEGERPPVGDCRLLGVQLESLPEGLIGKLALKQVTVETPDGTTSDWLVYHAERHCSLRLITLVNATPRDVFAGCIVTLSDAQEER
jgi:hypothetical protein